MSQIIQNEVWFCLLSIATGVFIMLCYDLLRALRSVFPERGVILSVLDFLYWCLAGVAAFYMMFQKNSGILRGFSILGIIFGMIIYYKSISRIILKVFSTIIRVVSTIIQKILQVIFFPINILSKNFRKITIKRLKNKAKEIKMYFNKQ